MDARVRPLATSMKKDITHPGGERAPAAAPVTLRPAILSDVDPIFELIDRVSRTTTVLPRSREGICEALRDFVVVEQDGRLKGCGALNVINRDLAEIKSLVIAEELRGTGLGARLVQALVGEARRLGVRRVFALTDSVPFFRKLGFKPVDKATLPHKVWNECIRCPKFLNCQEESVDIILEPGGEAPPAGG
ncbi:MAG: N-acetyltransferase [bacterium]|nr:N-acetyltransferase [bacterium]